MKEESLSLPSMEYNFSISLIGSETKKNYEGQFTYKRLNLKNRAESSKMRCRLNGDLTTLEKDVGYFHEMIAWLRYGLIDYPDWWEGCQYGLDLYDLNIIEEIYKKVMEFEDKWHNRVFGEDKDGVISKESKKNSA